MEDPGEEKKEKEEGHGVRVQGTPAASLQEEQQQQQQQQQEGESSRERPAVTLAIPTINGDAGGDCDNHNDSDDDDSSSDDGPHEYFIPTIQVPKKCPPTITTTTSATTPAHAADEESNYFFSEPSISEDSSSLMQRHSQHSQQQQQQQQQQQNSQQQQQTPPQHPPTPGTTTPTPTQQQQHLFSSYQQQYAAATLKQQQQSPGNTSLSSWETEPSLHQKLRNHRVLLQFPQPVRRRRRARSGDFFGSEERTSTTVEDDYQPEIMFGNSGSSSKSTTPLQSPSEQKQAAENEYGQKQQQQFSYESLQAPLLSPSSTTGGGVEESIVMTLSDDSEDADNDYNNNDDDDSNNPNVVLVAAEAAAQAFLNTSWDLTTTTSQYHSADDEKSEQQRQPLPPLPRLINKRPHQHRRSRSGDAAAANVMGIKDWRGMEQDKIPMPEEHESDDEEEDNKDNKIAGKSHRHAKGKNGAGNNYSSQQQQQKQEYPSRSQRRPQLKAPPTRLESSPQPPQERTRLYNSKNNNHNNSQRGYPVTGNASGISPYGSIDSQQHYTGPASYGSAASEASPPPNLHGSYPPRALPRNHHHGNNIQDNQRAWMMQMSQLHPSDPSYASYSTTSSSHHRQQQLHRTASGDTRDSEISQVTEDQVESENSASEGMNVQQNRMKLGDVDLSNLAVMEQQLEDQKFRGSYQNVMRQRHESIFANLGKKNASKAPRSTFLPTSLNHDPSKYPTYVCPACGTRQRAFFSINDAPNEKAGPSSYLAVYFAIYVIASLFIFGLEEGWKPLDCIYFAVVTLTTAGLGDLTPTTDANKIICSIFIYFGVACIGLLLGSYIAGMLDERATQDRKSKLIASCPNCASLKTLKESAKIETRKRAANIPEGPDIPPPARLHRFMTERSPNGVANETHPAVYLSEHHRPRPLSPRGHASHHSSHHSSHRSHHSGVHVELGNGSAARGSPAQTRGSNGSSASGASGTNLVLGSPVTRRILGRQRHTRHESIDIANAAGLPKMFPGRVRKFSEDFGNSATPIINEGSPLHNNPHQSSSAFRSPDEVDSDDWSDDDGDDTFSGSDSSLSTSHSSLDGLFDERLIKIQNAKYLFLTLRQALVNSMVIIAVGCIGFWFIEGFSLIDSWYFTTVFLTTVGYGDITPVTKGGKLFATIYILVAGTILLNNMSTISMIPLELRKRSLERAVLTQFGDELDDAALRELATGPVIQRLRLAGNRPDGLDECTREMFSLAMLVRMGKVSEEEIRQTFAAFRRLDVNDEGVLNSKSIIAAMIQKRIGSQQKQNTGAALGTPLQPPPPPPPMVSVPLESNHDLRSVWIGSHGSLHVGTPSHQYHFEQDTDADPGDNEHSALLP